MTAPTSIVLLAQHPASHSVAVRRLEARLARGPNARLHLQFTLEGELERLRIPAQEAPLETDGLWRSTCFEAFVAAAGDEGYCEINLAPSRQWALYRFSGYRRRSTDAWRPEAASFPLIRTHQTKDILELHADVQLESIVDASANWTAAVTAVIEGIDGHLSYWSVRHAAGKPDFHHRDAFAIELAA